MNNIPMNNIPPEAQYAMNQLNEVEARMEKIEEKIKKSDREREYWKRRAIAMEKALYGECIYCIQMLGNKTICVECRNEDCKWEFNENFESTHKLLAKYRKNSKEKNDSNDSNSSSDTNDSKEVNTNNDQN